MVDSLVVFMFQYLSQLCLLLKGDSICVYITVLIFLKTCSKVVESFAMFLFQYLYLLLKGGSICVYVTILVFLKNI